MRKNFTPPSNAARCLKTCLVALTLTLVATSVHAQLSLVWTVPGVSNNGNVNSYFACTNRNTSPVTVGVEVFNASGTSLNDPIATTLTLAPKETRLFGTGIGTFLPDAGIVTGTFAIGTAEILASTKSKVNCSAWLAGGAGGSGMVSLRVVKGDKQRGE